MKASEDQYALLSSSDESRDASEDELEYLAKRGSMDAHLLKNRVWRQRKKLIVLAAIMIVGSLLLCMHSTRRRRRVRHITPLHIEPPQSPVGHALPQETQEDLGLDVETCRREFPLFYPQLQENADAWRQLGGIRASDVNAAAKACEGGCAHIVIANRGQIFLRSLQQDWQSRVRAVLQLLQKAIDSADPIEKAALDGTEFVFSTADKDGFKNKTGNGAGWVLDKRVTDLPGQYLIPDFSFSAWPEAGVSTYNEFRKEAKKVNQELPWREKEDKVFFRGDPTIKGRRASLLAQLQKPHSEEWADAKRTSFWETGPGISPIVTLPDHCRHKFLIHSEGNSYSGRSKFILGCASAVIIHDLEWTQHFHPAMIHNETSIDRNVILPPGHLFDNLEELARSMQAEEALARTLPEPTSWHDLTRAQKVASNANRTLTGRYLTPAATACYFRAALASYASVLDRKSWPGSRGPILKPGGGIKPGAGAGDYKGKGLKALHLEEQGDIHLDVWNLLGQPEWPPA